jgi:hypothetical protein
LQKRRFRVFLCGVTSVASLSVPAAPRDSLRGPNVRRLEALDAVSSVLRAFVLLPVFGLRALRALVDRTSNRSSLNSIRDTRRASTLDSRVSSAQPVLPWTITRLHSTPFQSAALSTDRRRAAATNFLLRRYAPSAESPEAGFVVDINETRNPNQREPARDAGRHPRGRPARRAPS